MVDDNLERVSKELRVERIHSEPGISKEDAHKASARRYYERNKDRLKAEALRRYEADKENQKANMRARYRKTRESMDTYNSSSVRRSRLAEYGLTPEGYTEMYETQNGLCAICHKPETAKGRLVLAVDHDHRTNKVRELLCQRCNRLLSMVDDSVEFLRSYITYLEKHSE